MNRIAYLISADMAPDALDPREDQFEFRHQLEAFAPAFESAGMALDVVIWDAPNRPWTEYDAAIIGTAWDYWEKRDSFLATLEAIEASGRPLLNPAALVRWNIDKGYLRQLRDAGVPIPPTRFEPAATPAAIAAAFEAFQTDEIVVKPQVGAGGWRQERIARGAPSPSPEALPPSTCLIQPFLTQILEGEYSLLVYAGAVSHALIKRPAAGDYRVQSTYGGRETPVTATPAQLDLATRALAETKVAAGITPTYARVDMIDGEDGPLLMELELIEPYHYPVQGPGCGPRFAAAVRGALDAWTPA